MFYNLKCVLWSLNVGLCMAPSPLSKGVVAEKTKHKQTFILGWPASCRLHVENPAFMQLGKTSLKRHHQVYQAYYIHCNVSQTVCGIQTFEHMCPFVYFDWEALSGGHCCTISNPPINCVKAKHPNINLSQRFQNILMGWSNNMDKSAGMGNSRLPVSAVFGLGCLWNVCDKGFTFTLILVWSLIIWMCSCTVGWSAE